MRTKNAMQLKARVNARAKEEGIPAQMMMQNYLLERLLERLSLSPWRQRVIVKGGMLVASMVGIANRTTMDLDTTVSGFELTHESAGTVFKEVASIDVDDDWSFEFVRVEDIRELDDYPGIRVHLMANYAPMAVPLVVDLTTGDRITPEAVEYEYHLLFDDRDIVLMTYPLETVLAEKLETIVSRGVASTRPRDIYDVHVLWKLKRPECDLDILWQALLATCGRRGSLTSMSRWRTTISEVSKDASMVSLWERYAKRNPYVGGTTLLEACGTVADVLSLIPGLLPRA